MMKRALIVGGANGIGLSLAMQLSLEDNVEKVYIVDKAPLEKEYHSRKIESYVFDLSNENYSFFSQFEGIDALIITAGFGKLALFNDLDEKHIISSFQVNTISVIRLIKHFYTKIQSDKDFYCGVMVSIAGFMSSPFFSVYGATKAALKIFIESVNVELEKHGTTNRILNVSPGSIRGTNFYKGQTDLKQLEPLTKQILSHLMAKDDLFIPLYDEVYKEVLSRYYADFRKEGLHSYEYKLNSRRITK